MDEAIGRYPPDQKRSAALPLLHLGQEHFGLINDEAVTWIAAKLGLQPINILELVTFYPMLREKRAGKTHIRVCRTLSCAMAGSYQVMENLCAATGIQRKTDHNGMHTPISRSADGKYSIEFVECLASCGTAPVCMVDDALRENVDPTAVTDLVQNQTSNNASPARTKPQTSPHPLEHRLILKNIGRKNWKIDIDTYLKHGGYEELRKAIKMSRTDIVNEVKTSGLRGRGGAGFPCGVKWSFIKPDEKKPVYLICNADESEPGTFKDRYIIHEDPHQLLEGIAIACFALGAKTAYIYIRGEFPEGAKILERAIEEAREHKFLGRNILGSGFVCVSGDVERPGYFEIEVGKVTMGQLIYDMAGGIRQGRQLKAVIPGGSSAKVLRADERFKIKQKQADGSTIDQEMSIDELPMDFDTMAAAGSMAGSGGVIVLDDSRDMVWVLNNINEFYAHESCGQCTPCREGSLWMKKITDRMLRGGGVTEDPRTLKTIGDNIAGRTISAFGEACACPTQSSVEKFPEEFATRARKSAPPPLPPEQMPQELVEETQIPTTPMAHDPGWEKAGTDAVI